MKILKTIASIGKGIGKALIHDILPIPDLKNISGMVAKKHVAEGIRNGSGIPVDGGKQIADLLDDGKLNQSVNEVRYETITRMVTSASGLIVVLIYVLTELF